MQSPFRTFEEQAAEAASFLKTLSNESRLRVLCQLVENAELSVGDLVVRVGLSQSALSQHLARLREEGLVATRKDAQTVFYRICDPRAHQVLALLHNLFCPQVGDQVGRAPQTGDRK